jgi:glyoxylase-like metal-dependent hydrolase (beta-lactamase superfamily II)
MTPLFRIELPTPFPIGTANAFLLPGDGPVTLFDAGPRTPEALAALEQGLREHGLAVEDVELLVLTHHHIDHAGLAETVRARSGCAVAAHRHVADILRDLPATQAAQDAWARALLRLHGAPEDVVATVAAITDTAVHLSESLAVSRTLEQGDTIVAGGRTLSVHLRPGHSRADTLFVDKEDGWAVSGDHVLPGGPAVAVAERPPGEVAARYRPPALLGYRASFAATARLGLALAYPGHGPAVTDVAGTIAARLTTQDRRAARLLRELDGEPRTAWELVEAIRGGRVDGGVGHPISEAFIVLSDVVSHLDLLVEDGRAVCLDGEPMRYAAA